MSSNNNEKLNSPNPLTCVGSFAPEFGISPVSSLSANLNSNLSIRRNLVFSCAESSSIKTELDESVTPNSSSSTTRMLKHTKLSSEGGGGGGGSPNSGGVRFSSFSKRPTPTDKENSTIRRSYSMDYSLMSSDSEVSPSKFAIAKQMCRERYPLEDQDPNSQDSGYSNSSSTFSEDSKLSSNFRFAEPNGVPPRSTVTTDSPGRDDSSPLTKRLATCSRYRKQLLQRRMSTDSISTDLSDDGFDENSVLPSVGSMIVVRSSVESDFSELVLMEPPLKRSASDEETGVFLKRRKPCTKLTMSSASVDSAFSPNVSSGAVTAPATSSLCKTLLDYGFQKTSLKLQRSFSESAATIAKAIEQSTLNPNLIGDCSRPFALPLKIGRHADQRNIDCHTLARLMRGEYDDKVGSYTIIDCRYPYEYEAGHIKGAINIHTPEKIKEELIVKNTLRNLHQSGDPSKHHILIFHCEFSSERGPSLSRYLRKVDRDKYGVQFPKLDYPEIYLLHGGYSEFYSYYKQLCDPCFYQKMIDSKYANEMSQGNKERTMFSRSKSWATADDNNQPKPRNTTFKRLVL